MDALRHILDFGLGEEGRATGLEGVVILFGQRFDFYGEPHGLGEVRADGDHAVMGEKAGFPILKGFDRIVRERLGAEGGIGRAADVIAAGDRDHVVQAGNVFLQDGECRAEGGVGVDDGIDVRARVDDVQVKAPFGGRDEVPS